MPAGKKFLKGGSLGKITRQKGIVGGGIPVDAARAEAKNAEARAAAVGFGEIAVVFKAELASVEIGMEIGDAAPNAVVAIAEFGFEAERFADSGVNAVTGDDEVGFGDGAVFKMQMDGVGALFKARKSVAEVDGAVGHGQGESGLEFGAMEGEAGAIVGGERQSLDAVAVLVFHQHAAKRPARSGKASENFRVDLIEGTYSVGPEAHAGADFF